MITAEANRKLNALDREATNAARLRDRAAREIADHAAAGRTDTPDFHRSVDLYRTLDREATDATAAYTAALKATRQ